MFSGVKITSFRGICSMPDNAAEEIREAVATCIETGEMLRIAEQSEKIARETGSDRRRTAQALLEAGIMARVNIEFGRLFGKTDLGQRRQCGELVPD
jgi:hypothetical protein